MEQWNKTSTMEPSSLGTRQKNKRKMEEDGDTSTDHCHCHFSNTRFHKGRKVFPVVQVPHGVFRRPADGGKADGSEIQIDHINSPEDIGRTTSMAEDNVSGSTRRKEDGDHHQRMQNEFILKDHSQLPAASTGSTRGRKLPKNVDRARQRVMEIVREFRAFCDQITRMDKEDNYKRKRVDFMAAKMVKKKFYYYPDKPFLGPVPGVEIGDEFHYRMELHILGLHRPSQGGIDYVQDGGRIIATSIVDSGLYDNYKEDQDTLVYCGQGGHNANPNVGLQMPEDQQLKRGNLALRNSIRAKNPVRVIRGRKLPRASTTYFYDGLYTVEKMWEDKGQVGKRVFKFKLVKMPGQASLFTSRN
ncbi:histone-lysine N-methyltransferase, H3 lysine-9 specific SUVH5-like [Coffea arabica]|uniref:Histone-lysine N-methyltransferase, H3 lysine-9 specific SUVH5-like n=1 Tax=Coffea arabica TaxID=13443 RepID=A0A6P6U1J3_COFAR